MKRLIVVVALLSPLLALAQVPKPQNVIFGPQGIKGITEEPGVPLIQTMPKPHFRSLIQVRANFQPELQKSVDGLK